MLSALVSPLGILTLSILLIVVAIAVFRINAFFTLMVAALFVALMAAINQTGDQRFTKAIEQVMTESGVAMSRVGFPIALAAVIGMCLMESGAADKIIRRFIAVLGESRAAVALLLCSFFLAAPVFVDTVLMLMLPLARALSLRTGKDYLFYVLAICTGAAVSNGTIPPAPGPLFVAETLKIDLGFVIIAGALFGILPLIGAHYIGKWFNSRIHVPVRPAPGSTVESLQAIALRPESELPGFWASIAPVLVPVALIAAASLLSLLHSRISKEVVQVLEFLGNKNIALTIGAVIAIIVYARQRKIGWRAAGKVLGAPLETAGVIILIIAAGGAYGAMIKNAGVGESVRQLAGGHTLNFVLLAWITAAVLRAALGSATVATITAIGIMLSIAGPAGFGVHRLYILIAIGFGGKFLSWMNDPGFWVICRLGGLTQGETLRSWTIAVSLVSIIGLIEVLVVSALFPQLPF